MSDTLSGRELDALEFAMDVYGAEGGSIDSTLVANICRAMNCNPSLETLEKAGIAKKKGEKKFTKDEIVPLIIQLRKNKKDEGCYEDFVECLKLYDKNDNNKMVAGELGHMLKSLGECLDDAQVDELLTDCLDDEDDEGEVEYLPFLKRMCEKEPPLERKKK